MLLNRLIFINKQSNFQRNASQHEKQYGITEIEKNVFI